MAAKNTKIYWTSEDKDNLVAYVDKIRKEKSLTIPDALAKAVKELNPFNQHKNYRAESALNLYYSWLRRKQMTSGKAEPEPMGQRMERAQGSVMSELALVQQIVNSQTISAEERKLCLEIISGIVNGPRKGV